MTPERIAAEIKKRCNPAVLELVRLKQLDQIVFDEIVSALAGMNASDTTRDEKSD